MKYIITDEDEAMIGNGCFHQDMGDKVNGIVIAAGHCRKNEDGTFDVWGESIGYNIMSKQEDARILEELDPEEYDSN